MRHSRPFLTAGILLTVSMPAPGKSPQTSPDSGSAVEKLQHRYASVESVTADFTQIYRAPGIEQVESGTVWMKKPGLMRWEYRDPEEKIFVADGSHTYLYTPEDRQVLVRPFSSRELQSTPLQFLLGQGDLIGSFSAGEESVLHPKLDATMLLRLTPKDPQPDYDYVVLELDSRTFELRRIVIREQTGNTSEFVLTNISTNARLDGRRFKFQIPKGVDVIRMDVKD